MTGIAREWATVEEHVTETLHQQEETMSSPVHAALSVVLDQAAVLESDANLNPLSVILAARHVGRSFSPAECVALADFLAALEAEKRGQQQAIVRSEGNGHATGPQRILQ